jgi:hypothetical protein
VGLRAGRDPAAPGGAGRPAATATLHAAPRGRGAALRGPHHRGAGQGRRGGARVGGVPHRLRRRVRRTGRGRAGAAGARAASRRLRRRGSPPLVQTDVQLCVQAQAR